MTQAVKLPSQHSSAPQQQRVEKFAGGQIIYKTVYVTVEGRNFQLEVIESAVFYDDSLLKNIMSPFQYLVSENRSPATTVSKVKPDSTKDINPITANEAQNGNLVKIAVGTTMILTAAIQLYSRSSPADKNIKFAKYNSSLAGDNYLQLGLPKGKNAELKVILADLEDKEKNAQKGGQELSQLEILRLNFLRERTKQGDF